MERCPKAVKPVLERLPDFAALLESGEDEAISQQIRKAETIGRPIGSPEWLDGLEKRLGRIVRAGKLGPQAKGMR
ncbi:MAG: hypothetical protein ABW166_08475 [Sedimenticola sp.]